MKLKKLKVFKKLGVCVLSAAILLSLAGCTPKNVSYSNNNIYFDTVITLTVYDPDHVDYMQDCFDMAARYEQLFSRTIPDSDISKINNSPGEFVEVSEDTIELLEYGIKYCELSGGVFDITVGALSDTWDFKNNEGVLPSQDAIESALNTVDYNNILIEGNTVCLNQEGAMIDLGGIAKGYIADQMKDYLVEKGVSSALINLGGNVLLVGSKVDNTPFSIGIQKPFGESGEALAKVDIEDCTLVSSGVYERYFKIDDNIYHHILNTDTGYPVDNELYGVTIICEKSIDGDGLSTTVFSLGLEEGMKLIESLENTEAIFVTDEMEVITSSGIGTEIPFQTLN